MSTTAQRFLKKAVSLTLALAIVTTFTFTPYSYQKPPVAHAQFGGIVIDPTNLVQNTINAVTSVSQLTITQILNGIAWTVAKVAIASIQRSTVNWINSGFKGSPAFVTDLNRNLQNVSDAVTESFLSQLNDTVVGATGFNIHSPFQNQLVAQLRNEYYKQSSNYGLNPFTLAQSSQNPTAFLNGDFSQGGFNAYSSATLNPANNPFGAYRQAQSALFSQIDQATAARKAEYTAGNGFLSARADCAPSTKGLTSTLSSSGLPKSTGLSSGLTNQFGVLKSGSGSVLTDTTAINTSLSSGATSGTVNLSTAELCLGSKIITPGSVIKGQLDKALGANIDSLVSADQINEIIGALANQLVSQVIGSNGLLGASSPSSSNGGQSPVNAATSPTQNNTQVSSLADGFLQSVVSQRQTVMLYQNNVQKILSAANNAKQACTTSGSPTPTEVQNTIDTETAALAKVGSAISSLDTLSANITSAQSSPVATRSTTITSLVTQNQNILTSSSMPSAQEIAQAGADSQDTGTATTTSAFTRMNTLANSCRLHTI